MDVLSFNTTRHCDDVIITTCHCAHVIRYTTALDKNKLTPEQIARAEKLAGAMMSDTVRPPTARSGSSAWAISSIHIVIPFNI